MKNVIHSAGLRLVAYNRQAGFSLVELMVAAALGLLLIGVVGSVYLSGRQSFRDQDETSRIQENGRFVMNVISNVLYQTARTDFGPGNTIGIPPVYTPGLTAYPIIPMGSVALDATDAGPDTITVRYVSATPGERDCLGNWIGAVVGAPRLVTQTITLAGTDLNCTSTIGGGGPLTQPLASGIEAFEIRLGVDTDNDGFVDDYVAPNAANAAIARSVSVCFMTRTADNMSPEPQQYTDCDGNVVVAGDRRIRRAFTQVIGLRNRLG